MIVVLIWNDSVGIIGSESFVPNRSFAIIVIWITRSPKRLYITLIKEPDTFLEESTFLGTCPTLWKPSRCSLQTKRSTRTFKFEAPFRCSGVKS